MERLKALVPRVRQFLGGCGLREGTPLLAAVSGGADSVLLARVLAETSTTWPLVGVLFVDHGLRDVSLERAAAERTAADIGVPFEGVTLDVTGPGNLQERAREARYRALEGRARELGALVATGHTMTDQAETVLARAIRGSGLRGLAGIRARTPARVRPLLTVAREEARAFGWLFVDDPSNATDRYARNRLRLEIFPLLARENPRVVQALADLAVASQAELELIDRLMERDAATGPGTCMAGRPSAEAHTYVRWRVARDLPAGISPRSRAVSVLVDGLTRGDDVRVSLGRGVLGRSDAGVLSFEPDEDPRWSVVALGIGRWSSERAEVLVAPTDGHRESSSLSMSRRESAAPEPGSEHQECLWMNPSNVSWPLTLRPWNLSDSIGNPGGWVLCDGAGRRLWADGVVTDPSLRRPSPQNTLFTYLCVLGH